MRQSSESQLPSCSARTAVKINPHIRHPSDLESMNSTRVPWRKPLGEFRSFKPRWENMRIHTVHRKSFLSFFRLFGCFCFGGTPSSDAGRRRLCPASILTRLSEPTLDNTEKLRPLRLGLNNRHYTCLVPALKISVPFEGIFTVQRLAASWSFSKAASRGCA